MNNYSAEERRTILYVLTEVMMADGVLRPEEQRFFDKMFSIIEADIADMTAMEHIDNGYALSVFNAMSEDKQKQLRNSLYEMAMADGILDSREQAVLDFYNSPTKPCV
ncbi:MAG: hypothetical protein IKW22_06005 [Bacteroidaceae bacterium]|nr:hypothetical protein [Bacteroidaceae bacterium]